MTKENQRGPTGNNFFTLPDSDSNLDSDSDSKPQGYIVLCRNF